MSQEKNQPPPPREAPAYERCPYCGGDRTDRKHTEDLCDEEKDALGRSDG